MQNNYKIHLKCKTSTKQTNNLFEYESIHNYTSNYTISYPCSIIPKDNTISINKPINNKHPLLIKSSLPDKYTLHINSKESNYIYLDVYNTFSYENNGYELHEGDLLSFGNIKFKITKIHINNNNTNNLCKHTLTQSFQIQHNSYRSNNNSNTNENTPKCRICFTEEIDNELNPLITPCNCIGSIQYIHLECLKQWLKSKITFREYRCLNILTKKKLQCELCNSCFPENISIQTQTSFKNINLIEYPQHNSFNYFTMEYIPKNTKTQDITFIYTVKFDIKNTIYIGRANSSDLKMTDISISRNHGVVHLTNGKFYVRDMKSKYGTFVEYKHNDILLLPNKVFSLLVGKCLIEFNMKRTLMAILKCVNSKCFLWKDYNSYISDKVNWERGGFVGRINTRKASMMKMINTKRSSNREMIDSGIYLKHSFNKSGLSLCNNSSMVIWGNGSHLNLLGESKEEKMKKKEGDDNNDNIKQANSN